MNRSLLKQQAKDVLKSHYWKVLLPIVVVSILNFEFISFEIETNTATYNTEAYLTIFDLKFLFELTPFILSVFILSAIARFLYAVLFGSVFNYGLSNKLKYVALGKGDEYDIFEGFRHNYKKIVILDFMASLHIILYSLLLVVPGIIKALEYSFIYEIYDEHPDWTYKQVLNESKRLTYGHKWEIFVLSLSFILWSILFGFLDIFTFGLANYLLRPYMKMTDVMCYFWLKSLNDRIHVEAELISNENMFDAY